MIDRRIIRTTDKPTDRSPDRQTDRMIKQTDRRIDRQTDRWMDRWIYRWVSHLTICSDTGLFWNFGGSSRMGFTVKHWMSVWTKLRNNNSENLENWRQRKQICCYGHVLWGTLEDTLSGRAPDVLAGRGRGLHLLSVGELSEQSGLKVLAPLILLPPIDEHLILKNTRNRHSHLQIKLFCVHRPNLWIIFACYEFQSITFSKKSTI